MHKRYWITWVVLGAIVGSVVGIIYGPRLHWGVILKNLIVGLTALSCGFVLWLAWTNIRAAFRFRDPAPAFYAMARIGLVLIVGLVAEAVFRAPEIPVTVRALVYTLGLALVTVGYAGVIVYERRRPSHPHADRKVT